MDETAKTIAVIRGADGTTIQETLRLLVDRWRPAARIAGVLAEDHGLPDRACSAGYLRSIKSGERFTMFRDRGAQAKGCQLDGDGVLQAADAVRQDIAQGCDLVVLSKFAGLEAAGRGLSAAFTAALDAGVPVLTSVSPNSSPVWEKLVSKTYVVLPADADRIDNWWQAVRREQV
jgi:hypothetical protein